MCWQRCGSLCQVDGWPWQRRVCASETSDSVTFMSHVWRRIIGPNQKLVVTCAAIANGASTQWDFAYQRYLTTNLASEKETLLKALSCSRDTAILSKYGPKYFEKKTHTPCRSWSDQFVPATGYWSGLWIPHPESDVKTRSTSCPALPPIRSVSRWFSTLSSTAGMKWSNRKFFFLSNWTADVTFTPSVLADDNRFPSLYVLGRLVDSITLTLSSPSQLQHVRSCLSRNLHKFLFWIKFYQFLNIFDGNSWRKWVKASEATWERRPDRSNMVWRGHGSM